MASKAQISSQHDALVAFVGAAPDGVGLEDISTGAGLGLDRRTLQRRLDGLLKAGRIVRTGQTSDVRYHAVGAAPVGIAPAVVVPVSKAGAKLLAYLGKPVQSRKIVGYERGFLDRYRPNVTAYLTAAEKSHLRALGTPNVAAAEAAGTYAKAVLNRLLIDLSWNSSRLEGNTYSLLDTKRLVEFGQAADGKDHREAQMILNHKAAIEFLVQSAGDIAFDRLTVMNLHALLADGLLDDADSPGRLRRILVGIAGSTFHPTGVPQLIAECFDQILATATAIADPFEQALFVMAQLPYLQPFDDVNKRVSRLAANIPLIRGNLCPLSFIDVPKETYSQAVLAVYECNDVTLLKDVFLWAYERSANRYAAVRQQIGDPDPFRLRYRAELREIVASVIQGAMTRRAAFAHIAAWANAHVPAPDSAAFRELAETELMALHMGNFARYRVRPSEFTAWHKGWRSA